MRSLTSPLQTSGATKWLGPSHLFVPLTSFFDLPKSQIPALGADSSRDNISKFQGLISLCMIPREWRFLSPSRTCLKRASLVGTEISDHGALSKLYGAYGTSNIVSTCTREGELNIWKGKKHQRLLRRCTSSSLALHGKGFPCSHHACMRGTTPTVVAVSEARIISRFTEVTSR